MKPKSWTEARVRQWAATAANRELTDRLFPLDARDASTELPGVPWFRLAMYREVSAWTARDWALAINSRWSVWAELEAPPSEVAPIARVAPFIVGLSRSVITGDAAVPSGLPLWGAPSAPVVAELDKDEIRQAAEDAEGFDRKVLAVDLNAADDALEAAFAAWLKRQRPMAERRAAMTASDMRNFAEAQAIPYLDIHLFELASGARLRVNDVAAALFPSGSGRRTTNEPAKMLDKTTRMYARRLLSPRFWDRMLAQFAPPP